MKIIPNYLNSKNIYKTFQNPVSEYIHNYVNFLWT